MFRIYNLNCWSVGDNEALEAPDEEEEEDASHKTSEEEDARGEEEEEIGSSASKWEWKQKMHLIRLRKKTTVPKMYMWELPPSACVGASTVCVCLYR